MEIENLDNICNQFITKRKHRNKNPLAPQHPFRCLMVGPSGSGKTNLLANLILKYLEFDKIYIYAKDIEEDIYKFIVAQMKVIEELYNKENDTNESIIEFDTGLNNITLNQFDGEKQNLVIFDDQITESKENQKIIDELFVRGRKTPNCSMFYLTQSYFDTPPLLKKQCNYVVLLNVGTKRELIEIAKTYATDVEFKEFCDLYKECVSKPYGFMAIDLKTQNKNMKYRCGFDSMYVRDDQLKEKLQNTQST